jgi:hypothetical protein
MMTGYFGRAGEFVNGKWRKGAVSMSHFVDDGRKPLCGYRPHETMKFLICANGIHEPYVSCTGCRAALNKMRAKL